MTRDSRMLPTWSLTGSGQSTQLSCTSTALRPRSPRRRRPAGCGWTALPRCSPGVSAPCARASGTRYSSLRVLLPPNARPLLQSSRLAQTRAPPRCALSRSSGWTGLGPNSRGWRSKRSRDIGDIVNSSGTAGHRPGPGTVGIGLRPGGLPGHSSGRAARRRAGCRAAGRVSASWPGRPLPAPSASPRLAELDDPLVQRDGSPPAEGREPQPLHAAQQGRELFEDAAYRGFAQAVTGTSWNVVVGGQRRVDVARPEGAGETGVGRAHGVQLDDGQIAAGPPARRVRAWRPSPSCASRTARTSSGLTIV